MSFDQKPLGNPKDWVSIHKKGLIERQSEGVLTSGIPGTGFTPTWLH